jgi:hypothetical protein
METVSLSDPRWPSLTAGYRVPYDASIPLRALASGNAPQPIWDELWQELHHQGDVGEASYAAAPHLVTICIDRRSIDWNLFALVATIEACRDSSDNPPMPNWLAATYAQAWEKLFQFGIEALRTPRDELTVRSIMGVIAIHRGLRKLGRLIGEFDSSEIDEIYDRAYG